MSKFLVTGGAGFIGSHLVEALLKNEHEVIVLDNLSTGKLENIQGFLKDIRFIKGDILNPDTCLHAASGVDYILHQAAMGSVPHSIQDPLKTHITNVNGTLNVLMAARERGVGRVVLASTCAAYGNHEVLPLSESSIPCPLSPYAVSKLAAESYASVFHSVYGLETISLRYFNVFGPKQDPLSQYAAVIPNFIMKMLNFESPEIYGDGEQTRDFTYISNVVQANMKACYAGTESCGKIFNIACQEQISLNRVFQKLNQLIGRQFKPVYRETRTGDVRHSLADISLAKNCLGYCPEVDFERGLEKTLEWQYQQQFAASVGN